MNLYIWEGVLTGYTDGMIVAIAPNLETALTAAGADYLRADMGRVTPTVIEINDNTKPECWHVYGGS
jgi:hypothetical protein